MSVEDISAKFHIKTIPRIIGEPIYKAINKSREAMYKNVAAIPTEIGGGINGPIGLIVDEVVFANVATTAYASPTEPGPYAQHRPGD